MNIQQHEKSIELVYEHSDFIIVHKPSGLDVHNKAGNLIDLLELELKLRLHAVHRLDQETSGLLLLAKTAQATTQLQTALSSSQSQKIYLAIVKGQLASKSGIWSMPISAKAEGRKQPAGLAKNRRPAQTEYTLVDQTPWLSLLTCRLQTGRQHQIRKHCALAGYPIIGDQRYGDPKHTRLMAHKFKFNSLALHAYHLSFNYLGNEYSFIERPPSNWEAFGLNHNLQP